MRPPVPGGYRVLEWGQCTSEPGSLVRDADGQPVFTHSRVRQTSGISQSAGEVIELVDEEHVRVAWEYGPYRDEPVPSNKLVVIR